MDATRAESATRPSGRSPILHLSSDSAYLWYAGFVVVPLAYYLLFYKYGIDLDDEGFFLDGASAIVHSGQLPLADFMSYPPWMYVSLAGFFHLFGETLLVERAFLIVHLLVGIVCLLWLSRKMLPPLAAGIPVFFYAAAPGPWYRSFFAFGTLIVTVALLFFNDRPSTRRAAILGLATGFAAIVRIEVAAVSLVVFAGAFAVLAFCDIRNGKPVGSAVLRYSANSLACLVAIGVVPALTAVPYAIVGKLHALWTNIVRYINPTAYGDSVAGRGLTDMFRPLSLFSHPSLEQWVYAVSMLACILLIVSNTAIILRSEPSEWIEPKRRILLGAMAIASMGETFFFVWDSRMLSTFAIVTLVVVTLLYDVTRRLPQRQRLAAFGGGCAVIAALIFNISKPLDYYSGSIAVFRPDIPYRQTIVPFLKGAKIWAPQANTIDELYRIARKNPDATLVPMTYCTTLAYLSGLRNPTYYRLFTSGEMPGQSGQQAAIKTFERDHITYFVARRGTFFSKDDPGAVQLDALPLIKSYLLEHYQVRPLGESYVILVRGSVS